MTEATWKKFLRVPFYVPPAAVIKDRFDLEYGFSLYNQIIILYCPIVKFIYFIYNIEQTQYYGGA